MFVVGQASQRRKTQICWLVDRNTVFPLSDGSPGGLKLCRLLPSVSLKVPDQCCCARLPAELTQRMPLFLASATVAFGDDALPVPSPRLVLNQLAEWTMTLIPFALA